MPNINSSHSMAIPEAHESFESFSSRINGNIGGQTADNRYSMHQLLNFDPKKQQVPEYRNAA